MKKKKQGLPKFNTNVPMPRVKKPKEGILNIGCPICKAMLTPTIIEHNDNGKQKYGWLCSCTEEMRKKYFNISYKFKKSSIQINFQIP